MAHYYSAYAISQRDMDEMHASDMEYILKKVRHELGKAAGIPIGYPDVKLRFNQDEIFGGFFIRMTVEV